MAPRSRAKTSSQQQSKPSKQQPQPRQPSKFGELDTTPTSRQSQSPSNPRRSSNVTGNIKNRLRGSPANKSPSSKKPTESQDGNSDVIAVESPLPNEVVTTRSEPKRKFSWSEAGSQTRRSTPAGEEDCNSQLWDFDDLADLPNAVLELQVAELVETVLQPGDGSPSEVFPELNSTQPIESLRRIDFSETASTARRSSPVTTKETSQVQWEFSCTPSIMDNSSAYPDEMDWEEVTAPSALDRHDHFPVELCVHSPARQPSQTNTAPPTGALHDNTYQKPMAPPPRPNATSVHQFYMESPIESAPHSTKQVHKQAGNCEYSPPSSNPKLHVPTSGALEADAQCQPAKGQHVNNRPAQSCRKRKQRAKTPLAFDEATQEIVDSPPSKKRASSSQMLTSIAQHGPTQKQGLPPKKPPRKAAAKPSAPKKGRRPANQTQNRTSKGRLAQAPSTPRNSEPKLKRDAPTEAASKPQGNVARASSQQQTPDVQPNHVIEYHIISDDTDEDFCLQSPPVPLLSASPANQQNVLETNDVDYARFPRRSSRNLGEAPQAGVSKATIAPPVIKKSKKQSTAQLPAITREMETADLGKVIQDLKRDATTSQKPDAVIPLIDQHTSDFTRQAKPKLASAITPLTQSGPQLGEVFNMTHLQKAETSSESRIKAEATGPAQNFHRNRSIASQSLGNNQRKVLGQRQDGNPELRRKHPRNLSINEEGSPILLHNSSQRFPNEDPYVVEKPDRVPRAAVERTAVVPRGTSPRALSKPFSAPIMTEEKATRTGIFGDSIPGESRANGTVSSFASRVMEEIPRPSHPAPPELQASKEARDIQAQIYASFQRPGLRASIVDTGTTSSVPAQKKATTTQQSSSGSDPTVVQRLHELMDKAAFLLETRGTAIHNVSIVYRTNGFACVDKIQHRFAQESRKLVSSMTEHAELFRKATRQARKSIVDTNARRNDMVADLEKTVSKRKVLYERAIDKLRAVHSQILSADLSCSNSSLRNELDTDDSS